MNVERTKYVSSLYGIAAFGAEIGTIIGMVLGAITGLIARGTDLHRSATMVAEHPRGNPGDFRSRPVLHSVMDNQPRHRRNSRRPLTQLERRGAEHGHAGIWSPFSLKPVPAKQGQSW